MDKTLKSLYNIVREGVSLMADFKILENGTFGVELIGASKGVVTSESPTVCGRGMKPYERLFMVTLGEIVFTTGRGRIAASAGDIVYLPTDCEYESVWSAPGEYYTVVFALHDGCAALRSIGGELEIVAHDREGKYLSVYKRMHGLWIGEEPGRIYACISAFWELIRYLCIDADSLDMRKKYASVCGAVMWLYANFQSEKSAGELARLCGLSESAFRREFKERTGTSPVKFRNELRLGRAREIIRSGEYNISEAAAMVGFSDVYYFSKAYKERYGKSPSEDK